MSYRFIGAFRTAHYGPSQVVRTLRATLFVVIVYGVYGVCGIYGIYGFGTLTIQPSYANDPQSNLGFHSNRGLHSLYPEGLPTGSTIDTSLYRGLTGHEQLVEIRLPVGVRIAPVVPGTQSWDQSEETTLRLGLQVGSVWRFRLTQIPLHDQAELYPTVELFDRLYTPDSLRDRFPLRIELTQSDLEFALAGKLVTRVIYLEDPETALPVADADRGEGLGSFDIAPGDDPITIADLFGRPLAIVRIGGRSPMNSESPDLGFTFGAPPYLRYPSAHSDGAGTTNTVIASEETMGEEGEEVEGSDLATAENPNSASAEVLDSEVLDSEVLNSTAALTGYEPSRAVVDPSLGRGEYLLNGGDRELREHGLAASLPKEGDRPLGLDLGDAVATFESLDGEPELVVINRVPLYSPRLSSIRKLTGLTEQSNSVGWRDMRQATTSVVVGTREVAATRKQHESLRGAQSEQKASGAMGTEGLNRAETAVGLAMHRDEFQAWENFQQIRTGETDSAEGVQLSASAHAARSWEQPEELRVFFGDDVVSTVASIDTTSVVYFVDDAEGPHAQLRVTKVASTSDATSGETVEFTIRYDNTGEAPIVKVRIVDSLSPRLEYVAESAESSLPSQFQSTPNKGGSVILEWELEQPLLPGEGGIVRFKTKVR